MNNSGVAQQYEATLHLKDDMNQNMTEKIANAFAVATRPITLRNVCRKGERKLQSILAIARSRNIGHMAQIKIEYKPNTTRCMVCKPITGWSLYEDSSDDEYNNNELPDL